MRECDVSFPKVAALRMLLARDEFSVSRFLFSVSFFGTLTHDLVFDTMRYLHLSPFSVRAESWPRTSRRCFASMITSASQSQGSHRMHAYSGPSSLFFSSMNARLKDEPLSLCMGSCVQQFYASTGHGVQDGIQPASPRKPSCIHHRR